MQSFVDHITAGFALGALFVLWTNPRLALLLGYFAMVAWDVGQLATGVGEFSMGDMAYGAAGTALGARLFHSLKDKQQKKKRSPFAVRVVELFTNGI